MKTITFGVQKGGTGKTSISFSVASQLALDGKTVLYIDADPQGNGTGWALKSLNYELADVLFNHCQLDEAIHKTSIEHLFMLPSAGLGGDLRLYSETVASQKPYAITKLLPQIQSRGFDYVIIDTSPSFGPLEKQCHLASDEVIPVLQIDIFSLDGLATFTSLLKTLREDFNTDTPYLKRLILNTKDDRLPQQATLLEEYKKWGVPLYIVPTDQSFKKCQGSGFCIQEYANTKRETLEAIKEIADSIK